MCVVGDLDLWEFVDALSTLNCEAVRGGKPLFIIVGFEEGVKAMGRGFFGEVPLKGLVLKKSDWIGQGREVVF